MKESESLYSVLALRISVVLMCWQVAHFIHDREQQDAYSDTSGQAGATS